MIDPLEGNPGRRQFAEFAADFLAELIERELARTHRIPPGFEPAQIEGCLDHTKQLVRVLPHALHWVALGGYERAEGALDQEIHVPADDVQRRAQLVRHGRHELRLEDVGRTEILDELRVGMG